MNYVLFVAVGLLAGFLSALLGIGGGVVMVPALVYLVAPAMKSAPGAASAMKLAVGTSLAYIVPVAISGALQHASRNQVMWKVLILLVPCGLIGTYLGVRTGDVLSGPTLKRIFGVLVILVGLRMFLFAGKAAPGDGPVEPGKPVAEALLESPADGQTPAP